MAQMFPPDTSQLFEFPHGCGAWLFWQCHGTSPPLTHCVGRECGMNRDGLHSGHAHPTKVPCTRGSPGARRCLGHVSSVADVPAVGVWPCSSRAPLEPSRSWVMSQNASLETMLPEHTATNLPCCSNDRICICSDKNELKVVLRYIPLRDLCSA